MTVITLDITNYILLGTAIFFSNLMAEISKDIYHSLKHHTKNMRSNHVLKSKN
jgi:K+ transporter